MMQKEKTKGCHNSIDLLILNIQAEKELSLYTGCPKNRLNITPK